MFEITETTKLDRGIEDGRIIVYLIPENPIQKLRGIANDLGFSTEEFLKIRNEERQLERERDRRKFGI